MKWGEALSQEVWEQVSEPLWLAYRRGYDEQEREEE